MKNKRILEETLSQLFDFKEKNLLAFAGVKKLGTTIILIFRALLEALLILQQQCSCTQVVLVKQYYFLQTLLYHQQNKLCR
ncbi:hypothetical protein CBNA_1748 [Coxiella burnetii str. Namibia]|nr:hypothetical protein CBNA_1748 [Coxiella burnetii str. Namibia]